MMVDYSDWLKSLGPSDDVILFRLISRLILGLALGLFGYKLIIGEFPIAKTWDSSSWRILTVVLNVLGALFILACAVVMVNGMKGWIETHAVRASAVTFTVQTERTFGIKNLKCRHDCPAYVLPADRTSASWMQGDRFVRGTILVDGTKVGLAGPDGRLLKAVD